MIKSIQNISFGGMVANALLHKILRRKGKVKKEVKLLLAALAVTLGVGWMSQPVLAEESADTGSGAASSGSCGVGELTSHGHLSAVRTRGIPL